MKGSGFGPLPLHGTD